MIPEEAETGANLKAKSWRVYKESFGPASSVRTSMADCKKADWLVNQPLYAVDEISRKILAEQETD